MEEDVKWRRRRTEAHSPMRRRITSLVMMVE